MKNSITDENIIKILRKEDQFFKIRNDEIWVTFCINGVPVNHPVESSKYVKRIRNVYFDLTSKGMPESMRISIIATLKALADRDENIKDVYLRAAEKGDNFYYDLSNDKNEMVEITKEGWSIINSNDVIFERLNNQRAQLPPEQGGNLDDLLNFINIDKKYALLFQVYIVSSFVPEIQHPIIILFGERGQGKTTICRFIKSIVDPCDPDLISMNEQNEEDFFLNVKRNYLVGFDNNTKISTKISDNLCKLVTGIGVERRKRYSDLETITFNLKRCIALSSIENLAVKEDLLSRSIAFEAINKTGEQIPEKELFENFEWAKPCFLSSIFDILSSAMSIYHTVSFKNTFRMAEFAKWGYAISEAMGKSGNEFLSQYQENIDQLEAEAIAANPLVCAIKILMNHNTEWSELSSVLFKTLLAIGHENGLNMRSEIMPDQAPLLLKKMKAYRSILKNLGIIFSDRHVKNGTKITLMKV